MHLERYRRRKTNWRKLATRLGIIAVIVAAYAAYWVITPTSLEVPSIAAIPNSPTFLAVTIHNPTAKWVTGQFGTIDTEYNIHSPRGSHIVLSSVAQYPFSLPPFQSQTFSIPMNGDIVPSIDYTITLHIDGVGAQTFTVTYS